MSFCGQNRPCIIQLRVSVPVMAGTWETSHMLSMNECGYVYQSLSMLIYSVDVDCQVSLVVLLILSTHLPSHNHHHSSLHCFSITQRKQICCKSLCFSGARATVWLRNRPRWQTVLSHGFPSLSQAELLHL